MSPVNTFKKWMRFNFLHSIATNPVFCINTEAKREEGKNCYSQGEQKQKIHKAMFLQNISPNK